MCSHTPVRTRGSANSMMTVTPPMNSETGFLNTRHDTESGDTNAGSPAGREKSTEDWSPGSRSARVASSKPIRNGHGAAPFFGRASSSSGPFSSVGALAAGLKPANHKRVKHCSRAYKAGSVQFGLA